MSLTRRVLSIQSHVVHGYVGNKAAVFPLQLLGMDVDFINSVQFSNHTEYKTVAGQKLGADQLDELYDALKRNELLNYTHLLTGYVSNKSFLNKLADIIDELKAANPDMIYLCDPVLGDNGKMYVPKELLEIYKKRILPKADIITPNMFELELIYGKSITSVDDVKEALSYCHNSLGIKTVVISSCPSFVKEKTLTPTDETAASSLGIEPVPMARAPSPSHPPIKFTLYASSTNDDKIITIEFERIPGTYYGTGDAFAAMLLAWLAKLDNLKSACEHTTSAMLHILKRTSARLKAEQPDQMIEISLIQSKRDIEDPEIIVKASYIGAKENTGAVVF